MDYNPRGNTLGGFLRSSPGLRDMLLHKGEVARRLYRTGVRKRSGTLGSVVRVEVAIGGIKRDRQVATITASTPYAAAHEFGTTKQKGYHEMRAALEAVKDS